MLGKAPACGASCGTAVSVLMWLGGSSALGTVPVPLARTGCGCGQVSLVASVGADPARVGSSSCALCWC